MVRNTLYLVAGTILLVGCVSVHSTKRTERKESAVMEGQESAMEPAQVLRHVVLLKFKQETTAQQIKEIERAFCALPGKIDAVHDFEWGTDVSVENLQQGFTHCFVVTFASEEDRARYLPHPAHKEFANMLGPYIDDVIVIDYWTKP
jgi:hypothetical protein